MSFEEALHEKQQQVDEILAAQLPAPSETRGDLVKAMRYGMEAGGKRIRPILMMESYRLFGGRKAVIEPFAAAIEMVHTHSLIHDDLPALDDDDLRRGKPTTHRMFGEALGVLAGDALLNLAYETALKAFMYTENPERVIWALQILAKKTGYRGMLGGQAVDVENEKKGQLQIDRDTLDYIYRNKTGALLEAPLMIGAALGGAEKGEVACMEEIGRKVGLAFQIQDDILDVTASVDELGKSVLSDEKNQKTTYVTLMGVEKSAALVHTLTAEAERLLDSLPGEKDFLKWLFSKMAMRRK